MIKSKWVIIRLETKSRELYSKLMLTYLLLLNGYSIIITNRLCLNINIFPKGIYLINNITAGNHSKLKELYEEGYIIDVLDEEGLVYLNDYAYTKRIDTKSIKYIDKFFCFGADQFRVINDNFSGLASKCIITGNPRINILGREFYKLRDIHVNNYKHTYGRYILIVSNFSLVNLSNSGNTDDDKYRYACNINNYLRISDNKQLFDARYKYIYNTFTKMIEMINIIALNFPDTNIIVRPHPSEDIHYWQDKFTNVNNVFIIREGVVNDWIAGALLVIQNNCTSAIESLLLKVPCITYNPFSDDRFDQPLPQKISIKIHDVNTIINSIVMLRNGDSSIFNSFYPKYILTLENYISNYMGFSSANNIVDEIITQDAPICTYGAYIYILKSLKLSSILYHIKELIKSFIISKQNIIKSAYLLLHLNNNVIDRINRIINNNENDKYGNITTDEISEIINIFSDINDISLQGELCIKHISGDYMIYLK